MGSLNAHKFAVEHPSRVERLVLVGSATTLVRNPNVIPLYTEAVQFMTDPLVPDWVEFVREYKAKRNKTPGEFSSQLPLIEEVLTAMRIPFLKKEGYEADDIIGTLVTEALADGSGIDEVLILTGDRDSIQLVTDRSTVLYPMRGVSDLARMTPAAVEERYFATPARYPELAALVECLC